MMSDLAITPEMEVAEILVRCNAHIGAKIKVAHMARFVYRQRSDGVHLFEVKKTLERLNLAARLISLYPPDKTLAVSTHVYGTKAVLRFAEVTGARAVAGKIPAGMLTNRVLKYYVEPEVVIVSDPRFDAQIVEEARIAKIPVIAMCSTDNTTSNVDLVIPINNRGRHSLPFAFWYLARRVLIERGQATPELLSSITLDQFITHGVAEEGSEE